MPHLCLLEAPGRIVRTMPLTPGISSLGRDPSNDHVLGHPSVSRFQARLLLERGEAVIEDCGSRHGTFVAGVRIVGPTPLRPGVRVRVGTQDLLYAADEDDPTDSVLPSSLSTLGPPPIPRPAPRPAATPVAVPALAPSVRRTVDCRWRLWWRFHLDAISLGWQVQRSDVSSDPHAGRDVLVADRVATRTDFPKCG